jgi:hypothetical protein
MAQNGVHAELKTIQVNIPFVKKRHELAPPSTSSTINEEDLILKRLDAEPAAHVVTLSRHIPVPPGLQLESPLFEPYDELTEQQERERIRTLKIEDVGVEKKVKKPGQKEDKDQWLARAMKRNTEILSLAERVRPLSKAPSFATRLMNKYSRFTPGKTAEQQEQEQTEKKVFDFTGICSTTEERSVLAREALIQLVHQHLATKGYAKSIKTLAKESGVPYNGIGKHEPSYLRALLQMGIKDAHNIYKVPSSSATMTDLDNDTEVQTSSILNHLDPDHVDDKKKKLWNELSSQDEDNLEFAEDGKTIRAGTLNKLVEKLTDVTNDAKFFKTFLCTYRSFTVPEMLLAKLLERYKVPDTPIDPNIPEEEWKNMKFQIQIRTGNVIQKWIENYFSLDWNSQMIHMLTQFIDDFLLRTKQTAKMGKTIRVKLNRKILKQDENSEQIFSQDPPNPVVPKSIFSPKLEVFDIDPIELARQFTIREYELYKLIEPAELLNLAWSKDKLKHRAPHVIEITNRFNSISNWSSCQIVTTKSLKERKNKMKKILDIAKACLKINNISTVKAILAGLQNAAVHRLKFTTEDLPKSYQEDYEMMLNVTNQDKNFRNLRAHILSCSPPLVPFLGVYLTDLTFIEDGNPDYVASKRTGRNLINWTKRKLVFNVIQEIQQYQYKPYNLQKVYQIQQLMDTTFKSHVYIEDPELFKLSLEREPRGADIKSLTP